MQLNDSRKNVRITLQLNLTYLYACGNMSTIRLQGN